MFKHKKVAGNRTHRRVVLFNYHPYTFVGNCGPYIPSCKPTNIGKVYLELVELILSSLRQREHFRCESKGQFDLTCMKEVLGWMGLR